MFICASCDTTSKPSGDKLALVKTIYVSPNDRIELVVSVSNNIIEIYNTFREWVWDYKKYEALGAVSPDRVLKDNIRDYKLVSVIFEELYPSSDGYVFHNGQTWDVPDENDVSEVLMIGITSEDEEGFRFTEYGPPETRANTLAEVKQIHDAGVKCTEGTEIIKIVTARVRLSEKSASIEPFFKWDKPITNE